jgi:hypothetical protein
MSEKEKELQELLEASQIVIQRQQKEIRILREFLDKYKGA